MSAPLRVAVIGTGFGTSVQIPGFQAYPHTEVVAVVSAREARAREAADRFGIPHAFTDYRDALALPEVDVVSIVSPPVFHHRQTLDAFAAGKHVLCEKPMAMNEAEANEMTAAWRASGKVGMIDHEFRYVPARHYLHDLVQDGYVGRPLYLNLSTFSHVLAGSGRPWGWLFDASTGGGFLGALGSHAIDSVQWWCGRFSSVAGGTAITVPERIDPASGQPRAVTADDAYHLYGELDSGARVSVVSYMTVGGGPGARFEVYGSDGVLTIDNDNVLRGAQHGGELAVLPFPDSYTRPDLGIENPRLLPFVKLVERLVQGVRDGQTPEPSFADGMSVQTVLDAVRRSGGELIRL